MSRPQELSDWLAADAFRAGAVDGLGGWPGAVSCEGLGTAGWTTVGGQLGSAGVDTLAQELVSVVVVLFDCSALLLLC